MPQMLRVQDHKIIVITGDGASSNRKFFLRMHSVPYEEGEVCYKTMNPYTLEPRDIFSVSDVPHLIKTTRNCLSHSYGHGRLMNHSFINLSTLSPYKLYIANC